MEKLKTAIQNLNEAELLEILEFISNEIKKRNNNIPFEIPNMEDIDMDDTIKKLLDALVILGKDLNQK